MATTRDHAEAARAAESRPVRQDASHRAHLRFDQAELRPRWMGILNRHPAVGLAVGIVRHGSLELFNGQGFADIASGTPIDADTVFRIGSITKPFTAIAVMQLHEQGLIDLDAPANDYLRAYQLIRRKAGLGPATVRHLLTHTAGIAEVQHVRDLFHPEAGPFEGRPPILNVSAATRSGATAVTAVPDRDWIGAGCGGIYSAPATLPIRGGACWAEAPTSTARSSIRQRSRQCWSPTTSRMLGCRVGGSVSPAAMRAGIAWSGTTGSCRASTPRFCWLRTTASHRRLHERVARGIRVDGDGVQAAAPPPARCTRRRRPYRHSSPPRDLGRALRSATGPSADLGSPAGLAIPGGFEVFVRGRAPDDPGTDSYPRPLPGPAACTPTTRTIRTSSGSTSRASGRGPFASCSAGTSPATRRPFTQISVDSRLTLVRRPAAGSRAPLTAALGALLVAAAARSVTRRHRRSRE
jgi:hypothetical protein